MANPESSKVSPPLRAVTDGGRQVLDLLLKSGGLSQADITRRLSRSLTQPTVARLLQGFQQDGMVRMATRRADRPGNPSVDVTLNPDYAYALGVEMMAEVVSVVLMDLAGNVLAERSAVMPDMSRQAVLDQLLTFKTQLVKQIDRPDRLVGAGVGVSGFFVGRGRQINPPRSLADWALVDIEPILEEALGLPVFLDNNATTAAIGESLFGVGRTCADFAYMHLSSGFGGALIVDGKPMRGHHGNAGKYGGLWVQNGDGYPNLVLLRDCLAEQGHRFETIEDMVRTIDISWAGVETWLDQAVLPFSKLAGVIAAIIDPEKIVLGGRLPPSIAQALVSRISIPATTARTEAPPPLPTIVVAEVAQHPVAIGAAAMPLQKAFFA